MLLEVEKRIRGGVCHYISRYIKANYKNMKDYDENKELLYLKYWLLVLNGWPMPQKLQVNDFKWVEYIFNFDERFIKSYSKESDEGYFLKLIFNSQKIYIIFTMIYHIYLKE